MTSRTEIVVYRLGVPMWSMIPCALCRKLFRTYQSWPHKIFCSGKCRNLAIDGGAHLDTLGRNNKRSRE